MSVYNLIEILEAQGFKFSIWRKSRLRIHPSSTGYTAITPQIMAELVEKRPVIVQYLRAGAAVQLTSPQRREEPPVIQVRARP
jgi:hypothetical protein